MFNLMNEYKVQLKILYGFYEKIVGVNRELDKLSYIMFNQEDVHKRALLDAYIAPENEIVISNQIDRIREKFTEKASFIANIKGMKNVDKDNQIYDKIINWSGFTENEEVELNRLDSIKTYVSEIVKTEEKMDLLLAKAMGGTRAFDVQ